MLRLKIDKMAKDIAIPVWVAAAFDAVCGRKRKTQVLRQI